MYLKWNQYVSPVCGLAADAYLEQTNRKDLEAVSYTHLDVYKRQRLGYV